MSSRQEVKHIFISHSAAADHKEAAELSDWIRLAYRNVEVFVSSFNSIECGDDPTKAIVDGLRKADVLVLLMTPDAVKSPWVVFEAGVVFGRHIRQKKSHNVLPIVCKGATMAQLPKPIQSLMQAKDATKGEGLEQAIFKLDSMLGQGHEKGVEQLRDSLSGAIGASSDPDIHRQNQPQLLCRLRFDKGRTGNPGIAPHLRLDVENLREPAVRVASARVVMRSGDGGFLVYQPLKLETTSQDDSVARPADRLVFKFFKHRELAREATEEFWRRASIQKPMECAVVRLSDGRVFLAEQKEAQMAIDYFLGRKPLPTMKESPSARETNQTNIEQRCQTP